MFGPSTKKSIEEAPLERYTLAYRLPNGIVRGFVGHGPSRRDAYYDCIRRVGVKLQPFRCTFDADQVVRDLAVLPSGEQARVESDWHSQP
jgi:hypothetical protein